MGNFEKQLYEMSAKQKDVYAKALANFMFREVIEDVHVKYNISQDDIKEMCKEAVNRAALFLSIQETELYKPFSIYSLPALEWDDANIQTEFANDFIETLNSISKELQAAP